MPAMPAITGPTTNVKPVSTKTKVSRATKKRLHSLLPLLIHTHATHPHPRPTQPQVSVADDPSSWWKQYVNPPVSFSFEGEVKKATYSCKNLQDSLIDGAMLKELVKTCDGVAFLTVARGGVRAV